MLNTINSTLRFDYDLSRLLLKGLSVHASTSYDSYYYSKRLSVKTMQTFVPKVDQVIQRISSLYHKTKKALGVEDSITERTERFISRLESTLIVHLESIMPLLSCSIIRVNITHQALPIMCLMPIKVL